MTEIVLDQNSQLFTMKPDEEESSDVSFREEDEDTELKVSKTNSFLDSYLLNENSASSLPKRSKL